MESQWACDWSQKKEQQLFYYPQSTMINFMITDNKEKTDLYSGWMHLINSPTLSQGELFDPDQVCEAVHDTETNISLFGWEEQEGWTWECQSCLWMCW